MRQHDTTTIPDRHLVHHSTGTAYAFRFSKLIALAWDNGDERGVLVWGTDDAEAARPLAEEAVRHYFGEESRPARPQAGRWRLFASTDDPDASEWRPAEDAAEPSVLFVAEDVAR